MAGSDDRGVSYPGVLDPFTLHLGKAGYTMLLRSGVRYHRKIDIDG
ncbi:MAG: hypothetical protein M1436_01915 [Acidobacteria bacterium]|nr:hypothetical protein [Acidobacteriota bacterium]